MRARSESPKSELGLQGNTCHLRPWEDDTGFRTEPGRGAGGEQVGQNSPGLFPASSKEPRGRLAAGGKDFSRRYVPGLHGGRAVSGSQRSHGILWASLLRKRTEDGGLARRFPQLCRVLSTAWRYQSHRWGPPERSRTRGDILAPGVFWGHLRQWILPRLGPWSPLLSRKPAGRCKVGDTGGGAKQGGRGMFTGDSFRERAASLVCQIRGQRNSKNHGPNAGTMAGLGLGGQ